MSSSVSRNGVCAWKVVVVLCAALLLSWPAFAQLNLGTLVGNVTAQAGGPLSGATVTIVDEARGIERPLVTTASGEYEAGSLTPGLYTVRVAATGYKTFVHSGITVGVGANVKVDVVMQPGAETEMVTVTGDVSALSTGSAAEARGIGQAELTETPNNGGVAAANLENRPGFINLPGGGSNARYSNGQRPDENYWLIDGVNNDDFYTGYSTVNSFGVSVSPNPIDPLPIDAVQETTAITNPTAEFGYKSGQTINTGIKSGTNTLHGLLFGLGRDADMNARNPFSAATPPPGLNPASETGKEPFAFENFGGNIGGPIKKDKLFYFADFYRLAYVAGDQAIQATPTTASLSNALGNGALGNPTVSIPDAIYSAVCGSGATCSAVGSGAVPNQLSLNMAGCGTEPGGGGYIGGGTVNNAYVGGTGVGSLYSLIKAGTISSPSQILCNPVGRASVFGNGETTQNESLDFLTPGSATTGVGKLDWHINNHHSINIDAFDSIGFSNAWAGYRGPEPYWTVNSTEGVQIARAVWIWNINANNLNEVRYGFDRRNPQATNSDCLAEAAGTAPNFSTVFGLDTGTSVCSGNIGVAMPELSISGFANPTLSLQHGLGPVKNLWWGNSFYDNFSHTVGKHVLKAGVELHYWGYNGTGGGGPGELNIGSLSFSGIGTLPPGIASNNALEDFMVGGVQTGSVQYGNVVRNPHMNFYGAYIQDDYRVNSRISAQLGLRYEYSPAYTDAGVSGTGDPTGNLFGSVCISCVSGLTQETSKHPLYQQSSADNFGPHLGIAWDLTGKGSTVIRASFDILYSTQSFSGMSLIANVPTSAYLVEPNGSLGVACCGTNTSTTPTGTINNTLVNTGANNGVYTPWVAFGTTTGGACPGATCQQVYGNLSGYTLQGGVMANVACGNGLAPNANGLTTAPGVTAATNPAPCSPTMVVPNLRVPYVPQWDVDFGHSFGKSVTLTVSYVGNKGDDIRSYYDMNQPTLGGTTNSQLRRPLTYECSTAQAGNLSNYIAGTGATQGTGPYGSDCFPYFGQVIQIGNLDRSIYNALAISVTSRAYHGLSFNASYTWSHLLANSIGGENGGPTTPGADFYNPRVDIGNLGVPQHFTVTANWQIPGRKSALQMLQGWGLSTGILINPPSPAGVTDGSNLTGTGDGGEWTMGSFTPFNGTINFNSKNVKAFPVTGNSGPSCFGVAGSKYAANGTACAIVLPGAATESIANQAAYVSNMPAACVKAATLEASSPANVPASQGLGYTGGLYELASLGCYFENNTFIVPPAQGTFGLNEPGTDYMSLIFRQWDMALTKTWRFKERYNLQFRADCFNIMNVTNYSGGAFSLSSPQASSNGVSNNTANNAGAGIVIGNGSPREVQLGIRMTF